jgi:hypothetical protein
VVFNPASFDGFDVDAVRSEAQGLMSHCACARLTLRASGAGRAFIAIDPTSDISLSSRRHHTNRPQPSRSFEKPAGPSPRRMDPVKGTHCLEPRRLLSCSDTHGASATRGLLLADLECSVRSMAHRFTLSPPRARVSVLGASFGLRSADADRDTSDRLLPPNQPVYLHPRSWLSSYLSPPGDEPGGAMDRGTRRFTTSSPASAGPHAQIPGLHRDSFVRPSF